MKIIVCGGRRRRRCGNGMKMGKFSSKVSSNSLSLEF
jgi:hypothetical protein